MRWSVRAVVGEAVEVVGEGIGIGKDREKGG